MSCLTYNHLVYHHSAQKNSINLRDVEIEINVQNQKDSSGSLEDLHWKCFDLLFPTNHKSSIKQRNIIKSTEAMLDYWGLNGCQNVKKIERLNRFDDTFKFGQMLESLVCQDNKDLAITIYEIVSQHIGDDCILKPPLVDGKNIWLYLLDQAIYNTYLY